MRQFIFGLLLGLGIIVLLLKIVDLRQVYASVSSVKIIYLLIGLCVKVFVMWIKSFRWARTIHSTTGNKVRRAFSATMIGFAGNIILPARLGEIARINIINKHNNIGRTLAITTLVLAQLFDLLFLVGFFFLVSFWATSLFIGHRWEIGVIGIVLLLLLGVLLIIHRKFDGIKTQITRLRSTLPKALLDRAIGVIDLFGKGISILTEGHAVLLLIVLTILVWGLEALAVYFMLIAFNIDATPLMACLLVVVLNLSFVLPITPGNIGIAQSLSIILLAPFGVSKAAALAYSIASQGITYTVIIVLGLIFFYHERMNLNLLGRTEIIS